MARGLERVYYVSKPAKITWSIASFGACPPSTAPDPERSSDRVGFHVPGDMRV
jgi:hypothetical protein